jgi:lysophospholipase L1-like esterase
VALGDSMTEGVGDPLPGRRLRGWADRLADGLRELNPQLEYTKLAVKSLTSRQIRDAQLEPALGLEPDLAGAIVGMNDVLKPGFDPQNVREPLEDIVTRLQGAGATVLMATLPDITRILPLPERVKARMRPKLEGVNALVRTIAIAHDAVLVDAIDWPGELRRANWSIDLLHPNSRGHLLIARAFADKLGLPPDLLPEPERVRMVGAESARHARWLAREVGIPEVRRRAARPAAAIGKLGRRLGRS